MTDLIEHIRDTRIRPRIPMSRIARSILVMLLIRAGSLNSIEQTKGKYFWKRWLRGQLPSADSLGRIMERVEPDSIREAQKQLYTLLKRNKALAPTSHGLMALAIDGHESHATYNRCCSGCLERPVDTRDGWRTQYYHRNVTAMLLSKPFPFLVDAEPLQPGDDELAAARRLLRRVLQDYPRAFDIVLGDALYTDAKIYGLLCSHGKDVLSVLKANQPGLLDEARTLLETVEGQESEHNGRWREIRQLGGFKPWANPDCEVRVVRSRESRHVRRQMDGQSEDLLSEWLWATTCMPQRAHAEAIVALGHARWEIENQGFNEAVNHWHADHVYNFAATQNCSTFASQDWSTLGSS